MKWPGLSACHLALLFAVCEHVVEEGRATIVRIIAKSRLLELAQGHSDCVDQVMDWYRIASKETWRNLVEVRASFRHADSVDRYTVFNIKGTSYRLIVEMHYDKGLIYIKHLLTHAEYDKDKWRV